MLNISALLFAFVIASSVAWAERIPFACRLGILDSKTNILTTKCSGTFLNPHLFITAAHCFEPLESGPVVPSTWRNFAIECPDGSITKLKAVAVQPNYYFDSEKKRKGQNSTQDLDGNLFNGTLGLILKYDVALAITEDNLFSISQTSQSTYSQSSSSISYPKFPKLDFNHTQYPVNSCAIQGFSYEVCNPYTFRGCFRRVETVSVIDSEGPVKSELEPMLTATQVNVEKGDSGSGLICKSESGYNLVGVVTRNSYPEAVDLKLNQSFVESFFKLTNHLNGQDNVNLTTPINASNTVKLNARYKQVLIYRTFIQKALPYVTVMNGSSLHLESFGALLQLLNKDTTALVTRLVAHKIVTLKPVYSQDPFLEKTGRTGNIRIVEGANTNTLEFTEKAQSSDFEKILK